MEKLITSIESIIMKDIKTGFMIIKVSLFPIPNGSFFVKCHSSTIKENQLIEFLGFWVENNKFGKQFHASHSVKYTPLHKEDVLCYFNSGYIRGISKKIALDILNTIPINTLKEIDKDINILRKVKGVGEKTFKKIKKYWAEERLLYDPSVLLSPMGFSHKEIINIDIMLGEHAYEIIKDNPYELLSNKELKLSFFKIDNIAQRRLKYKKNDKQRILYSLLNKLWDNEKNGSSYILKEDLLKKVSQSLFLSESTIKTVMDDCFKEKRLKLTINMVQVYETFKMEKKIAEKLEKLNYKKDTIKTIKLNKLIKKFEKKDKKLTVEQRLCITNSFKNNINIINGSPGSGKTMILGIIVEIIKSMKKEVILTAYTGQASKKMTESTNHQALTMHKTLEYNPSTNNFEKNEKNKLVVDYILVDEFSMVDEFIFERLLRSIDNKTTLILIGDSDQLPSIAFGSILVDLIRSNKFKVSRLTESKRFTKTSGINKNAKLINNGSFFEYENNKNSDFFFIKTRSDNDTLSKIKQMVSYNIKNAFGYEPKNDLMILTPTHEHLLGRININNEIQSILNPASKDKAEFKRGAICFREGDNVIQLENDYDNDLFNGDMGLICKITRKGVVVDFCGKKVCYKKNIDAIDLSNAITIHKSQGSESPVVIIPISFYRNKVMGRSAFYTGITRGKNIVIVIGSKSNIIDIIKNDHSRKRKTCLRSFLI